MCQKAQHTSVSSLSRCHCQTHRVTLTAYRYDIYDTRYFTTEQGTALDGGRSEKTCRCATGDDELAALVALDAELNARDWAGQPGLHVGAFAFPKGGAPPLHDDELPVAAAAAISLLDVAATSGEATGKAMEVSRAAAVRAVLGEETVLIIASGIDARNAESFLPHADVFIVASGLLKSEMQQAARYYYPWTCPVRTFENTQEESPYTDICVVCEHDRASEEGYKQATAMAIDGEQRDRERRVCAGHT